MKGKHHIVIETSQVKYEFDISRNITVIQGDSATGKTTLIELLQTYARRGKDAGIILQSDVPCIVFNGTDDRWRIILDSVAESIVFFDEDYRFIFTNEFADYIRQTGNYYVFITRKPLTNLPYSIREIYGIRMSGRYHFPQKIYQEFYPIYPEKIREMI